MTNTGFTIVELVLVIAVMAILSFVSAKFFSRSAFDVDFTFETVKASLEFAQRKAVAANCPVQITFTDITIAISRTPNCTMNEAFGGLVPSPSEGDPNAPFFIAFEDNGGAPIVTIDVTPDVPLVFDGLGRIHDGSLAPPYGDPIAGSVTVEIQERTIMRRSLLASAEFGAFIEQ